MTRALKGRFLVEVSGVSQIFTFATIDGIRGNENLLYLDVLLKNDDDALSPGTYITRSFTPDLSSADNFFQQCYASLKTHDDFNGAEEVGTPESEPERE